jgi:methenyltetrahydrofolate cyclohydrolase
LASSDPLRATLGSFLDDLAANTPAPGSGAVAAMAVALGAALVEMAARLSRGWDGSARTLAAAEALRSRAALLAQADAEAYSDFLAARRRGVDDAAARSRTVAVPLEVAACASEVAALAASAAEYGNPNLRGEAVGAAQVARAGAAIASKLVQLNVGGGPDERLVRARELAAAAAHAAEQADRTLG